MPRTTVPRKLSYLLKLSYVTQHESTGMISDLALRTPTPTLDRAIKLILENRRRAARRPKWTTINSRCPKWTTK
jgi:hypothetical protein